MFDDQNGPIEHYSWGKFIILGEEHSEDGDVTVGKGKDIILFNNKVKEWKKRKGHNLTKEMVEDAIDKEADILIIGNGADGALSVSRKVIDYIQDQGIKKVIVEKTPEACAEYNKLYHKGKKVVLLAHGTC